MPADELNDDPDPRVLWGWITRAVRPYVGWILVGIGAILMIAGYMGVSREALPAKQIPYLVSGGIGGIFFAVLGAYFLGTHQLRDDSGRLDRLERMVEELHTVLLARPDAPQSRNGTKTASVETVSASADEDAPAASRKVVVVPGGHLFHRADCAVAEGKTATELTPAAARKRGMRPCPSCVPA